jgi:C-terminal processing protease CtpA/Prc
VVEAAAKQLEERYVFPDVGKNCGDHIKARLASGAYDAIADREAFARKLTDELQSISHDRHMRVRVRMPQRPAGEPVDPAIERYRIRREMAEDNFGFARVEVLEGNIGYLDITGFPPVELAGPTAAAAMKLLENVDALIVDLRRNGGGSPGTIQFISSYFFAGKTHLNSLIWREGARTQEFWTLDSIPGKRRPDIPIFVLTSGYTFSGGEEFAYNLKTRKRATLIGETTGGGANPGGFFPLDPPIGMFIPTGRALNPVTGDNWEGKGVEPDIRADSAQALALALEQARSAATDGRKLAEEKIARAAERLATQLREAERHAPDDPAAAREIVTRALDEARSADIADEISVNILGYEYLGKKNYPMAVQVLGYNARTFPRSANVYDSLGEGYMKSGNSALAIENYRKTLQVNPDNPGAREALRSLGVTE